MERHVPEKFLSKGPHAVPKRMEEFEIVGVERIFEFLLSLRRKVLKMALF
jgi:hypothetical protein